MTRHTLRQLFELFAATIHNLSTRFALAALSETSAGLLFCLSDELIALVARRCVFVLRSERWAMAAFVVPVTAQAGRVSVGGSRSRHGAAGTGRMQRRGGGGATVMMAAAGPLPALASSGGVASRRGSAAAAVHTGAGKVAGRGIPSAAAAFKHHQLGARRRVADAAAFAPAPGIHRRAARHNHDRGAALTTYAAASSSSGGFGPVKMVKAFIAPLSGLWSQILPMALMFYWMAFANGILDALKAGARRQCTRSILLHTRRILFPGFTPLPTEWTRTHSLHPSLPPLSHCVTVHARRLLLYLVRITLHRYTRAGPCTRSLTSVFVHTRRILLLHLLHLTVYPHTPAASSSPGLTRRPLSSS